MTVYAGAGRRYHGAGWGSPLPLPAGRKKPPPAGWTGYGAPMASAADVEAWCEEYPDGNIGMRLRPVVVGVDADTYRGPAELAAWESLAERWGPLPESAPWCTSRDDGVSGVRLLTVPDGYVAVALLPGGCGEVIQRHHRYVVVPPSVSPPPPRGTGQPYRWIGRPDGWVPGLADIPPLPPAWLDGLRAGPPPAADAPLFRQPAGHSHKSGWTAPDIARLRASGCLPGSRHDQLRDVVASLAGQGCGDAEIEAVWWEILAHTPPKDPPKTRDDFLLHLNTARAKYGSPGKDAAGDPASPPLGPRVVSLADVEPERIDWLWDGHLPLGKPVILDGDPGVGKSTVVTDIAARVTTGSPMPDGSAGSKGGVLVLSAEDGLADTIRPRLDAAGADPARVITITGIKVPGGEDGPISRPVSIPGDLPAIEKVIVANDVKLAIVDVLMAYLSGDVNAHRDQDIRRALFALSLMAERTGCCVIVLRHLNKSGGPNALYRGGGSIGIIGAARAGFMCGRDPDDETGARRVLANTKMNIAAEPPSLAYYLVADQLHGVARVQWDGVSGHSAGDLLAEPDSISERGKKTSAEDFLRKALADGPMPSKEIEEEALEVHGISLRTFKRARADLRIPAAKRDDGWWISLPEHEGDLKDGKSAKSAKGAKPPDGETALPAKSAKGANPATIGTVGTLDGWPAACLGTGCRKPARRGCSTCWDHAHLESGQ